MIRWLCEIWDSRIPMSPERWIEMFFASGTAVVLGFALTILVGIFLAAHD